MASAKIALLLLAAMLAQPSSACVWLMGEARDRVKAPGKVGTPWTYAYRGDDWEGSDAGGRAWSCLSGQRQSPINLVAADARRGTSSYKTTWSYAPLTSNGTNIQVFNNGHTIQVQWTGGLQSTVRAYAANNITDLVRGNGVTTGLRQVPLTPLQFHFHSVSEHLVNGMFAPLEMHIVHVVPQSVLPGCPLGGCLSVVGIMLHVSPDLETGNKALEVLFSRMPEREGVMEYLPEGAVLDIDALLPPANKRGYLQYEGSLTTPPCTEGLLWHVLKEPVYISLAQYNAYTRAVGLKTCNSTSSGDDDDDRRRSLIEHHDHHDHGMHMHSYDELVAGLESFQRGSYNGFVSGAALRAAARRSNKRSLARALLDKGDGDDDKGNYTCTIAAYGWTNRNVQPLNGRRVLTYN